MRAGLVALLLAVLCAAPAVAQHAQRRHPRPDHGRIIREQPRHHWRGSHGYRPRLRQGFGGQAYRNYGYRPFYAPRYGYGYGGYYGYRPRPLCTYWSPGYTAMDWNGYPVWVPPQPFVAACW